MKSFKQLAEESAPKFERATKTDVHYTGTINGKTWVVPHSFHGSGDVLHGTKVTPMRHNIVVSPIHVAHNNPSLTPQEHARVLQHIKDTHGGQEGKVPKFDSMGKLDESSDPSHAKWFALHNREQKHGPEADKSYHAKQALDHWDKMTQAEKDKHTTSGPKVHYRSPDGLSTYDPRFLTAAEKEKYRVHEDLKADWNRDFTQNRRSNIKRTMKQNLTVKNVGKGAKAWLRADKEDREQTGRFMTTASHQHRPYFHEEYDYPDPGQEKAPEQKKDEGAATRKELKAARPMRNGAAERFMQRYGKTKIAEDERHLLEIRNMLKPTPLNAHLFRKLFKPATPDVFKYHQTQIAKKTLRMPDAMVGVMGGMDKDGARAHLKSQGWDDKRIHKHEHDLTEGKELSVEVRKQLRADGWSADDLRRHEQKSPQKRAAYMKAMKTYGTKDLEEEVEYENLEERTLTPAEDAKKEEIVKSMKKNVQGFKDRYGKDAKSIMYATATKQAKKLEEEQIDEISQTLATKVFKARTVKMTDSMKKGDMETAEKHFNKSHATATRMASKPDFDFERATKELKEHSDTYNTVKRVLAEARFTDEGMHAYNVHHNGKHIDTIFYGSHQDPADVKRSLVNHDNYHSDITVTKQRKNKTGAASKPRHMEEMELKGINVTASRYHPGKTMVMDLDHRRRDKQQRTTARTSVANFLKAIHKIKGAPKKKPTPRVNNFFAGQVRLDEAHALKSSYATGDGHSHKVKSSFSNGKFSGTIHTSHRDNRYKYTGPEPVSPVEHEKPKKWEHDIKHGTRPSEIRKKNPHLDHTQADAISNHFREHRNKVAQIAEARNPQLWSGDGYDDKKLQAMETGGHLQKCEKCGRVRVFAKDSMTCPVCKTKKSLKESEHSTAFNTVKRVLRGE